MYFIMHFAGIVDHFSNAPNIEPIVWVATVGTFLYTVRQARYQLVRAKSTAGNIKEGSTGPRFWRTLAMRAQTGGMSIPALIYWIATACNKFRQPRWLLDYALPSPPDVFGIDGVLLGRAAGFLLLLAGTVVTVRAIRTLGDQLNGIGVSGLSSGRCCRAPDWWAYVLSAPQIRENPRLVDTGPYAYVRHPLYT